MDTGRRRWVLHSALTLVRAATLGCLLALVVIGALRTPGSSSSAAADSEDAYARVQARAEAGQRCASGPGGGSAVIRTEAGRLRVVSFAAGWAVYNGRRPGELVAVCAD